MADRFRDRGRRERGPNVLAPWGGEGHDSAEYDSRGRVGQNGGYHGRLTNYTSYPYGQQGYYSEPTWRTGYGGERGPEYGEGRSAGRLGGEYPGREDWMTPGPYTGRGPRGYRRADESIADDVRELLSRHGTLDASDIEVSVKDGEVTLEGTVSSRQDKRMAEVVADQVPGIRDVHNRLRIRRS